jgi:transcriptional regulator with XRE-family HTH domain
MAMAIKLGCHTQEVSAYEKGTRTPGRERALKLREVAGILIDAWDDPVEEAPEKPSEAVS